MDLQSFLRSLGRATHRIEVRHGVEAEIDDNERPMIPVAMDWDQKHIIVEDIDLNGNINHEKRKEGEEGNKGTFLVQRATNS